MKPINDDTFDALESVAVESVKQIKAFFAYQGSDGKMRDKAKVAAATISGFARLRASETNRMAVEFQMDRLGTTPAREPKALPAPPARLKAAK